MAIRSVACGKSRVLVVGRVKHSKQNESTFRHGGLSVSVAERSLAGRGGVRPAAWMPQRASSHCVGQPKSDCRLRANKQAGDGFVRFSVGVFPSVPPSGDRSRKRCDSSSKKTPSSCSKIFCRYRHARILVLRSKGAHNTGGGAFAARKSIAERTSGPRDVYEGEYERWRTVSELWGAG